MKSKGYASISIFEHKYLLYNKLSDFRRILGPVCNMSTRQISGQQTARFIEIEIVEKT